MKLYCPTQHCVGQYSFVSDIDRHLFWQRSRPHCQMKHRYALFFNSGSIFSSHCHQMYVSVTKKVTLQHMTTIPLAKKTATWGNGAYMFQNMWHVLVNLPSEVGSIYPQDSTSILLASIIHLQTHSEIFGPRCQRLVCQGILWCLLPFTLLAMNHRQPQCLLCEGS